MYSYGSSTIYILLSFRKDVIKKLDEVSKEVIYDNLAKLGDKVFKSTGIPLEIAKTIIYEGLEAKVS